MKFKTVIGLTINNFHLSTINSRWVVTNAAWYCHVIFLRKTIYCEIIVLYQTKVHKTGNTSANKNSQDKQNHKMY